MNPTKTTRTLATAFVLIALLVATLVFAALMLTATPVAQIPGHLH